MLLNTKAFYKVGFPKKCVTFTPDSFKLAYLVSYNASLKNCCVTTQTSVVSRHALVKVSRDLSNSQRNDF